MPPALDLRHESLEAFLEWEERQPERYERVGGIVRMMTGGTIAHNRIIRNCARALENRLSSDCEIFTSDVKVVSPAGDVMYPDVVVACGNISDRATTLDNPVVVAEVLSESTAHHDHGRKRWAYQSIPTLQHYVLIGQTEPTVEVASREPDGTWRSVILRGLDARMRLAVLEAEIGLDEVFARVTFAPPEPEATAGGTVHGP